MSYETGTVITQTDMIYKIKAFLEANGMVTDRFGAIETVNYWLHMHNAAGDVHVDFRTYEGVGQLWPVGSDSYFSRGPGMTMRACSGYDAAKTWHQQPGGPVAVSGISTGHHLNKWNTTEVKKYHFFFHNSPTMDFYCVVEMFPGIFAMWGLGKLVKIGGQWAEGMFQCGNIGVYGSIRMVPNLVGTEVYSRYVEGGYTSIPFGNSGLHCCGMLVKAAVDSYTGWFGSNIINNTTTNTQFYAVLPRIVVGSMCDSPEQANSAYAIPGGDPNVPYINSFMNLNATSYYGSIALYPGTGQSAFGGPTPLFPAYVYAQREPLASGMWSLIGEAPNFKYANIAHLQDTQIYTLGGEQYMVFPFFGRNSIENCPSGHYVYCSNGYVIKMG